jgi:lysophospholipase L1-like esterase
MDAKKQMDVSVQPYLNRWVGKKIVWVGTSIPAQGGEFSYPNRLGRMLGANVVNNARSSSLITYPDAFGLSGTTAELNAQTGTGQFSYQNLIIGQNADMLVIDHSVNDILNKLPQAFTGNINSTDRSTLYGAYNTIIQAAIADKPSIEIVIVLPPNKFTAPEVGANATTANYVTLIGILKEIANKYNAPFVNLAELSNINSFNYTNYKADGLHPTAADQERLAYILANQLIKNLMKKYILIVAVYLIAFLKKALQCNHKGKEVLLIRSSSQ